ncbi:MAG: anti-sigma factor [Chloracidobacterium sp.]|nr:anti-sigma factor [Chloracidobacterium sp.]
MNEEQKDIFFDLLTKKAIYGLDAAEQDQLDAMDPGNAELEFNSLEMAAAAISLMGADNDPMPASLRSKIIADANAFVVEQNELTVAWPPAAAENDKGYVVDREERSSGSWLGWLGWASAAVACIALALNLWFTRVQPVEVAGTKPPIETPRVLSTAELREEMLKAATDTIRASWAVGNVKNLTQIVGDVVWSDQKQTGYMRFKGLPVNDPTKEQYQLWIFDKNQDKATPIDGGVFNVNAEGEVIVPINAKIAASAPEMFAITVERPGGVVVSKRDKIAALAKVETPSKPSA